jgi:hypothetical protein
MGGCSSDDDDDELLDQAALQDQLAAMRTALGTQYLSLSERSAERAIEGGRSSDHAGPSQATPPTAPSLSSSSSGDGGNEEGGFELGSGEEEGLRSSEDEEDDDADLFGDFDLGSHLSELQSVLGAAYRTLGDREQEQEQGQGQGAGDRTEAAAADDSQPSWVASSPEHRYNREATAQKIQNLRKHEAVLSDALSANRKAQVCPPPLHHIHCQVSLPSRF